MLYRTKKIHMKSLLKGTIVIKKLLHEDFLSFLANQKISDRYNILLFSKANKLK